MDIGMRSLHPAAADHRVSIRGSRCTALIHPFASEPSGSGWSYCSPLPQRVFGERVRALRHSSGGHRIPILWGWTSGFSVGVALVLSAPLWCHSSRKCMRSSQDCGRHLSLPETNLVAPPPSPPSTVEPLWGTRASPWWSGLWPCNCVQQPLPPCGVTRVSPHGPVGISQV